MEAGSLALHWPSVWVLQSCLPVTRLSGLGSVGDTHGRGAPSSGGWKQASCRYWCCRAVYGFRRWVLRISETRFKSPSLAIDYRMGIPTIKEETFDTQILCVKWPTYPQRANRPPNGPPSRFKYYIYLGRTTKQTFYRDVFMQCKYNGVVVFVTNIVIVSRRTV